MSTLLEDRAFFSKNLKYYVEMSGKDQKEISAALGIPESTFSCYVTARAIPRYRTIEKIADYFGVKMSDLILEKEKEASEEQTKIISAAWNKEFPDVVFTKEEIKEIFDYARYVLAKRRE